jgi:protein-S-isoprenylcysteine O-methyltransferase Ste14
MPRYLAALTIVLMIGMVLTRAFVMKRHGTTAFHFGQIDKKDFIIPPFVLFYIYIVFAVAVGWPLPSTQEFFYSQAVSWIGILLCVAGLALLLWSIVSFGQSFRVGIDTTTPDKLITTGAFAISRNPIYVAFACILIGLFLTFPNWILLVYLIAAVWLFNRQVLREETYMKGHYGAPYEAYCRQARRYL